MPLTMENSAKPTQAPTSSSRFGPVQFGDPRLGVRQRIDDASEQNRFHEHRGGERQIGDRQHPAQARLAPEQLEHANVQAKEFHEADIGIRRTLISRTRYSNAMQRGPQRPGSDGQEPSVRVPSSARGGRSRLAARLLHVQYLPI